MLLLRSKCKLRWNMLLKECPTCGTPYYKKRKNQRFCSQSCRIRFNNRIAKEMRRKMKRHNLAIIRNYRLLNNLLNGEERLSVPYNEVKEKGFDVNSMTGIYQTDGQAVYLIYDIAYKKEKEQNNLIIAKVNY